MSTQLIELLTSAWRCVQPWMQRNVTFGLLLAIMTEVPRWTFAFMAAHEPVWAGCALAALMSYAAAHAWEEYFKRHDWLLLALNSLSLGFGVFTISPVIYAMTTVGSHSVSMKDILPNVLLWAWSIILASTTFLPLIQVAVVEVRRREQAQPEQVPAQRASATKTQVVALPVSEPVAQVAPKPEQVVASTTTQLDDIDAKVIEAVDNGHYTLYAISNYVGCASSTLKRKRKGTNEEIGRIPKLVAAGMLRNGSGDNGNEYRLTGEPWPTN